MNKIDLSEQLSEFYNLNKHKKIILNWNDVLKKGKGIFNINPLKQEGFTSIHEEKDFLFSFENRYFYYRTFFITSLSMSLDYVKIYYSEIDDFEIEVPNKNVSSYKCTSKITGQKYYGPLYSKNVTPDTLLFLEIDSIIRKHFNETTEANAEGENTEFDVTLEVADEVDNGIGAFEFDVTLVEPGRNLLKVVKLIADTTGLGLRQSKEKVDCPPSTIIEAVSEDVAEGFKKSFESAGAQVTVKLNFKSEQRIREEEERIRKKELKINQAKILYEFDKDGNGEVDLVEGNDFDLLLKKHQKSIVEIDRNYVQQFVKVSSYLKTKKGNIHSLFNNIKNTPNQEILNEYIEILKDDIHIYNLILFNSLNMIVSLVEDDMITFYEIYEMFDTLNMFDSKHEKDISQKLRNIGDGLESLMNEIRDMGNQISDSIQELSYVTEESNRQLENQLSEIDSTMKVGNLINVINLYQNNKTNKNTKGLKQ